MRELEHETQRLVYLCPEGQTITPSLLPGRIASIVLGDPMDNEPVNLNLDSRLEELERQLILRALALAKWNRTQAAKILGITRPGAGDEDGTPGVRQPEK